ncbi:MAG: protein-methionine-sulfoxide reductase catalytic subunit MsrP [Myxococcota bacterium]|nr:protein-methionine-sulfoxide reductase catalytic subunit MsrP [Myxococcota bacterium]
MHVHRRTHFGISESQVTEEHIWRARRLFLQKSALSGAALLGSSLLSRHVLSKPSPPESYAGLDFKKLAAKDKVTEFKAITTYNNFYEFGTGKDDPAKYAHTLKTTPWTIEVSGACHKPGTFDVRTLAPKKQWEERIYRLRCVEGWSMVIPWLGIPLAPLLKRFEPTGNAKFVQFETLYRPNEMPGQKRAVLDWPYVEGLRIDEAMNPLSFLALGLYGKTLPNQNGAPLRLVVPWKYGFKSIKSIVRISFAEKMPITSWVKASPKEYGFYSNVNPQVPHRRWSQKRERRIGEFRKHETLMFNGYGDYVADLYQGMDLKKYF